MSIAGKTGIEVRDDVFFILTDSGSLRVGDYSAMQNFLSVCHDEVTSWVASKLEDVQSELDQDEDEDLEDDEDLDDVDFGDDDDDEDEIDDDDDDDDDDDEDSDDDDDEDFDEDEDEDEDN
jgi:hypothetical protein